MFVRILNSEMELATGCTEPGAVALTAAEAGAALRKAGGTRVEAVTVRASINIIKNAMSAGIPGTSYQGMDYAAAIGAVGGDPVHLLEVMNYVPREQMEEAAALVKAGKVKVEVAQVPQKLYVEVLVTSDVHRLCHLQHPAGAVSRCVQAGHGGLHPVVHQNAASSICSRGT